MQDHANIRAAVLRGLTDDAHAIEQVLAYGENPFDPSCLTQRPVLPLPDEPHADTWRAYAGQCGNTPFAYLQTKLPQLNVPIRDGVSKTDEYARVARRGEPFQEDIFGARLTLERPDVFHFSVQSHAAGSLPILVTSHRADFETLCRALAHRSEPADISPAVNAQTITGLNLTTIDSTQGQRLAIGSQQDLGADLAGFSTRGPIRGDISMLTENRKRYRLQEGHLADYPVTAAKSAGTAILVFPFFPSPPGRAVAGENRCKPRPPGLLSGFEQFLHPFEQLVGRQRFQGEFLDPYRRQRFF